MSTPALNGDSVSDSDEAAVVLVWITLSRVADGGVTKRGDHYLDGGAPFPPYLIAPITMLIIEESLTVTDPDPTGSQQVTLTRAGQTRHEQLRRRAAREMDQ